jgi:hypothetical protein
MKDGTWDTQCYRALETMFDTRAFTDTEPPKDIAEILSFYDGIMFWFRFIDDMKDYGENLRIFAAGGLHMNEADVKILPSQLMIPNRTTSLDERVQVTEGLKFNGSNQFLRLGDSPDMAFGQKISLTTMRALCFWVKFDEFTNNAHIIDFGNGPGQDNVFVGIIGRGDASIDKGDSIRKSACDNNDLNVVLPDFPSGAQPVPDISPQELMLSTANVDEYTFDKEIRPRDLPTIKSFTEKQIEVPDQQAEYATLIWEVWNGKLRMEHVNVLKAFKLRTWTHCCITTASSDAVRPALQIWINGIKVAEKDGTHMPQVAITSNNYLGKNNWMSDSSQFENKPELFKGSLFDVRGYKQPMDKKKIEKTIEWGKKRLGVGNLNVV